jgi:hypothetical protein
MNFGEPNYELFEACLQKIKYYDYTIDDLCDYVYPRDNEYYGEFNADCKSE